MRLEHGNGQGHTNNTAELSTAGSVLRWLKDNCQHIGTMTVVLHGDSILTRNWLMGSRLPKTGQVERLTKLIVGFKLLAREFRFVRLEWHKRDLSVRILGH